MQVVHKTELAFLIHPILVHNTLTNFFNRSLITIGHVDITGNLPIDIDVRLKENNYCSFTTHILQFSI